MPATCLAEFKYLAQFQGDDCTAIATWAKPQRLVPEIELEPAQRVRASPGRGKGVEIDPSPPDFPRMLISLLLAELAPRDLPRRRCSPLQVKRAPVSDRNRPEQRSPVCSLSLHNEVYELPKHAQAEQTDLHLADPQQRPCSSRQSFAEARCRASAGAS